MAVVVNKLQKVCLSDMPCLTPNQMKEILKYALEKGIALRELSISREHRSSSVFHENQTRDVYTKLFPQVDLTKHPKIT